jgi:hypothetical protein
VSLHACLERYDFFVKILIPSIIPPAVILAQLLPVTAMRDIFTLFSCFPYIIFEGAMRKTPLHVLGAIPKLIERQGAF